MKLSVRRGLAVALALTYHVEARSSPLNARDPAPIVDEIDSSHDGGAAQEQTITKLVWVRNEPFPSHISSGHSKSSTRTHRPSQPPGGPPPDRPSATSNSGVEETQTSSSMHHSQNSPPPEQTSSTAGAGGPPPISGPGPSTGPQTTSKTKPSSGGPVRPPPNSGSSESSTRQTESSSEISQQPPPPGSHTSSKTRTHGDESGGPNPSSGNGSNPPSTNSQGPTASPGPTDSTNLSSAMTITSGGHTSTGAAIIPKTTVQITKDDDTSTVIFTGTSVTTSEGSEPTFAWGCSQDLSDICGAGPIPGGTGGCVVPLLCPEADNWGFGGGWVPVGSPPPGGPNPPPVDPEEPNDDDDNSTTDDPETSSETSTSNQETTTTPTSVSTTKTSTSSTATSTSKSKERLCLTVHEGTGTAEPTQTPTTTSKSGTSSTGSSTSARATTTSAAKVRMCLSVHPGSGAPESTQTTTRTSSTRTSTSSVSTTSAAKERLCLSVHEGSGSATSIPTTSTRANTHSTTDSSMQTTTTSPLAPSTRTHSSPPAPTSTPSTFSTATKTSEHSLCHPSSNPRGPNSCMCTSGSTQIYVPTLTGSDMCGYTKLPETTSSEQTTENTPTVTMPTPFVTTDSDHYVTSCDSATPSLLKAAGQTFTHPACAGNKYTSPKNGIFMAMYSPGGFGTLQWRSFFIGHNDQGKWDKPAFCNGQYLTSEDSSNDNKISDPPFPEGTFKIGDKMPDGNPQDCEYSGSKDEAGTLKCWGREFECEEWRLNDGTETCYDIASAKIYGPKVLCKFPDENGKLVGA